MLRRCFFLAWKDYGSSVKTALGTVMNRLPVESTATPAGI